ncbi:MAG: caspase family protein [Myxococcales bacterium]|nr:caspase family protein [Myxococcales bacterium]
MGANLGWSMDRPLRHAHADAHRLAAALTELGDFRPAEVVVLEDPATDELRAHLEQLGKRLSAGDKSLFVFYYSGHADDRYLHLRGPPLSLEELYRRVRDLPGTVKVGVLDACQSGSILAAKGGRPTASFRVQVQDELAVRGTAFLTSSGADELSQEARALAGSVFSHHLVSGLRGAADDDGDGRVSLAEAYRYASARTTLDTAATAAGAQRPSFRYELNGRGEVFLTRLQGPLGTLVFPPREQRCYLTDIAERRLIAEVAGEKARRSQLLVPAGSYVLKCLAGEKYRVTAVTASSGGQVEVAKLDFRTLPLSEGVLKGGGSSLGEDQLVALKRQGFEELKRGDPERALETFNEVLAKDLRDQEGYRGKAQAYLAMASKASAAGNRAQEERHLQAALQADPLLEEDPELASRRAAPRPAAQADDKALIERNLRQGHPRRYQRFGGGVSLLDGHGVLSVSLDCVPWEKLQPSMHLSLVTPGLGASFRLVPKDGPWSPFFGVGGQLSLSAMGLLPPPEGEVVIAGLAFPRRTFDRVLYLDAGFQGLLPDWQLDAGLALLYARPVVGDGFFAVMPVLSFKYLPSVAAVR